MNDPKRLLEEVSGFEAELLRSARKDAVSERSALAIIAALGVTPTAAAASALAVGAKAVTIKSVLTLGGLGAAAALSVWAGVSIFSGAPPVAVPASRPDVREQAPSVAVENVAPIAPAEAKEVTEPERPKAAARGARPAAASDSDSLPRELEMIDSARSALARGDAAQALSLLDAYSASFPKPRLRAESTVLRIEALVARGQSDAAKRLGKEFLARAPNGPYARRVRSLIEGAGAR